MTEMSFIDGMFTGYQRTRDAAERGDPGRVFDWDKAARLIREHRPSSAEAGLLTDWDCTGGVIYEGGEPDLESYTYLASMWATPALLFDDGRVFDCFLDQDKSDWDSGTKWPASALAILNNAE